MSFLRQRVKAQPFHSEAGQSDMQFLLFISMASTTAIPAPLSHPAPTAAWRILYNQMEEKEKAQAWVVGGSAHLALKECAKGKFSQQVDHQAVHVVWEEKWSEVQTCTDLWTEVNGRLASRV